MAGNYPDPISWRMAYDMDGTQGFWISSGNTISQPSALELAKLNSEDAASGVGPENQPYFGLIFPELRDIAGYWAFMANPYIAPSLTVETSANTTNGLDGTWTTLQATYSPTMSSVKPYYRSTIQAQSATGKKGIRFHQTVSTGNPYFWNRIHLYGNIASGENPNRLEIWHPTLDQRLPALSLDLGNVPRSSSQDVTFRVKNLSATQSANSVVCSLGALTDTSPSVPGQFSLSSDGSTFQATCSAGTLAAGAISSILTLRRVTPSNATLSLWDLRLRAVAGSWS